MSGKKAVLLMDSNWAFIAVLGLEISFRACLFIHLFISVGVPNKEPSHKMWGKHSHRPWSPTRTEGLHTMGCGLLPQGDR